jgi:hypothetical protein
LPEGGLFKRLQIRAKISPPARAPGANAGMENTTKKTTGEKR